MICLYFPDSKGTETRKSAFQVFFWLEGRQKVILIIIILLTWQTPINVSENTRKHQIKYTICPSAEAGASKTKMEHQIRQRWVCSLPWQGNYCREGSKKNALLEVMRSMKQQVLLQLEGNHKKSSEGRSCWRIENRISIGNILPVANKNKHNISLDPSE